MQGFNLKKFEENKYLTDLELHAKNLELKVQSLESKVQDLEQHAHNLMQLVEYMRLKNRLKRLLPGKIRNILKTLFFKTKRVYYLARKIYGYIRVNGLLFALKQRYYSFFYKTKKVVLRITHQ